ncbi:hypothetical protein K438DRAFT_1969070 [Mycena galopus ATCC 62051]|nr:hypothetical protein K438DRAFT_1969070 [Mycena galopus ATCC 62051]
MPTSLPPLDSITGALLVGTWASSLLYMAELLQAVWYFRSFKNDDWKLKTFVAVTFVIDTVSALGDYAAVYLYTITHAGDLAYLKKQNWAFPLHLISASCVAILVQSYLAFRYWHFTKNNILAVLLAMLILAAPMLQLTTIQFGGGLTSGLVIVLFPALKDRTKVRVSSQVWIYTQVAADLIIAAALVYELQLKARSKFLEGRRHRLIMLTIQTGSVTAVIAVAALIVFLINDETNISVGIMYILGRVLSMIYLLWQLLNLNIRTSGTEALSRGTSTAPTSIAFAHGTRISNRDDLGVVRSLLHTTTRHDLNGTFKSSSTNSQTPEGPAEGPAEEIEMTAMEKS